MPENIVQKVSVEHIASITIERLWLATYEKTLVEDQGVSRESVQYREMKKCFYLAFLTAMQAMIGISIFYGDKEESAEAVLQRLEDEAKAFCEKAGVQFRVKLK